jgi:hypothetical protein
MKRNLLILSILLFSIAQANCQKVRNIRIAEPEFSGTTVFVNDTIGDGVLLEQQTATMEGMVTLKYAVKSCCSTVSVDSVNSQFIVRVPDNSISPYDILSIVKTEIKNNRRTWIFSKPEIVEFKAKKYGINSYLITVPKFALGQYAICFKNSNSVNLFGVKLIKESF